MTPLIGRGTPPASRPCHRSTPSSPAPVTRTAAPDLDIVQVGRAVWGELPLMMVVSLMVTLACALTAVAALIAAPIAPLVAAVTLGPVWMAAVALAGRVLDGDAVGIGDVASILRRQVGTGIGLALVPAVVATLLIGSVGILSVRPDHRWLLLPIALDATALIVVALGSVFAFPLAAMGGLRGRERWVVAVSLAGRNLTTTVGLAALLVLLALAARLVGPVPALVMAGPLAILSTAAARRSVARAIPEEAP